MYLYKKTLNVVSVNISLHQIDLSDNVFILDYDLPSLRVFLFCIISITFHIQILIIIIFFLSPLFFLDILGFFKIINPPHSKAVCQILKTYLLILKMILEIRFYP